RPIAAKRGLSAAFAADISPLILVEDVEALVGDLHEDRLEGVEPAAAAGIQGAHRIAGLGLHRLAHRPALGSAVDASFHFAAGREEDGLHHAGILAFRLGRVMKTDEDAALLGDLLEGVLKEAAADDVPALQVVVGERFADHPPATGLFYQPADSRLQF